MLNVAVFADLPNLHYGLRTQWPEGRLHYESYLKAAVGEENLIRAIAYAAQLKDGDTGFLTALHQAGWETKHKRPAKINTKDGSTVQRITFAVEVACDMLTIEPKVQKVVLGCGNSDLVPPVRLLQARGIYVEVFAANIGAAMRKTCNNFRELTKDLLMPPGIVPGHRVESEEIKEVESSSGEGDACEASQEPE